MNRSKIHNLIKRLGFFYVQEIDRGGSIDFLAGHIPSAPFLVATLDQSSNSIQGPYSELLGRLDQVISRYNAESDDIVMLPVVRRQAWLADLASEFGFTIAEIQSITSGSTL